MSNLRRTLTSIEDGEIINVDNDSNDCIYDQEIPVKNGWKDLKNKQQNKLSQENRKVGGIKDHNVIEVPINKIIDKRNKDLTKALSVPVNCSKATRMMKLMGWKGGPLGKDGDGIAEPIMPYLSSVPRSGIGCTPKENVDVQKQKKVPKAKKVPKQVSQSSNSDIIHFSTTEQLRLIFLSRIQKMFEHNQLVELTFFRRLFKKECSILKSICTVFNTQEGFNMFTDSEISSVLAVQNSRNNRSVKILHDMAPSYHSMRVWLEGNVLVAPKKTQNEPKISIDGPAYRKQCYNLLLNSILNLILSPNPSLSHMTIKCKMTEKIVILLHKIVNTLNSRALRKKNMIELMQHVLEIMTLNPDIFITAKYDVANSLIKITKETCASSISSHKFYLISRVSESAFTLELFNHILQVLKDETPHRYINFLTASTEIEAKIIDNTLTALNNRQMPQHANMTERHRCIVNEIIFILVSNAFILLTVDFSLDLQYLRITKKFNLAYPSTIREIYIHGSHMDQLFAEIMTVFTKFFKSDENSIILRLKYQMSQFFVTFYKKVLHFLCNRKIVVGLKKTVPLINLYQDLVEAVLSGPDLGVISVFSSDLKTITVTKEPRFMTTFNISKKKTVPNNSQSLNVNNNKYCSTSVSGDISDSSDDDVSIISDETVNSTNINANSQPNLKPAETNPIKTLEDKLYDLSEKPVIEFTKFISENQIPLKDHTLDELAYKCKFLVTLERFLRDRSIKSIKLMIVDGYKVSTVFSTGIVRDFNTRKCLRCIDIEPLENLFKRCLSYDYCNLTVSNFLRLICLEKRQPNPLKKNKNKKKNKKAATAQNPWNSAMNSDDDICIIEENIDTVDLTEDNDEQSSILATDNVVKSQNWEVIDNIEKTTHRPEINEGRKTTIDSQGNISIKCHNNAVKEIESITKENVKVFNNNKDDCVTLVDNDLSVILESPNVTEIDLTEENDILNENITQSAPDNLLEALEKQDYFLPYKPRSQMFRDITSDNSNSTLIENISEQHRSRDWYPNLEQSICNTPDNVNLFKVISTGLNADVQNLCDIQNRNVENIAENSVMSVFEIIADTYKRMAHKDSIPIVLNDDKNEAMKPICQIDTGDPLSNSEKSDLLELYDEQNVSSDIVSDKTINKHSDESQDSNSEVLNTNQSNKIVTKNNELVIDTECNEFDKRAEMIKNPTVENTDVIAISDQNDLLIDVDDYDKDAVINVDESVVNNNDKNITIEEYIDLENYANDDLIVIEPVNNKDATNQSSKNEDITVIDKSPDVFDSEITDSEIKETDVNIIDENTNDTTKNPNLSNNSDKNKTITADYILLSNVKNWLSDDNTETLNESDQNKDLELLVNNIYFVDNELPDKNTNTNKMPIINISTDKTLVSSSKRYRSPSSSYDLNVNKKSKLLNYDTMKLEIKYLNPELKIDDLVAASIQKVILKEIDQTNFVPKLNFLYLDNGKLLYKVYDEASYDWFINVVSSIEIDGEILQFVVEDVVDERVKIVIRYNSFFKESCKIILNRISQFNDVNVDRWVVINKCSEGPNTFIKLEIDMDSFRTLKNKDFSLNLGIDIAQIY